MVKIKMTAFGGYIIGGGDVPKGFDADGFYKAFATKILNAQRQGLEEIDISDEEMAAYIASIEAAIEDVKNSVDEAEVRELPRDTSMDDILEYV